MKTVNNDTDELTLTLLSGKKFRVRHTYGSGIAIEIYVRTGAQVFWTIFIGIILAMLISSVFFQLLGIDTEHDEIV